MIAAVKRRFFPVEPVMYGYKQPLNRNWIRLRNFVALTILVFVGLFYGLLSAIFPVSFYIYMALPIIVIGLFLLWALPDSGWIPDKTIRFLFFGFLISIFTWPNYLALQLPGLPWITINRLITVPLAIIFLLSLSTSAELRGRLKSILGNFGFPGAALILFIFLQTATLIFSSTIGASVNRWIDQQVQWSLIFFVAAYVFSFPGTAKRWIVIYLGCTIFLCLMAVFEWRAGAVLWANSIPSFLAVADEATQRTLAGAMRSATKVYRVQSIFTTPLNFAEFLALSTPFLIFFIFYARAIWIRIVLVISIPFLAAMILTTDSRLGVVGFFLSFIIFGGIWGVRRWRNRPGDLFGPAVTMFYPFATALFFLMTLVSNRLGNAIYGSGATAASTEGRKEQFVNAVPKLFQWPLGYGTARGGDTLGMTNPVGVLTVDSYYIVMFLEYGILGGIAWFCVMIGSAVKATRWSFGADDEERRLLVTAATYMLAFTVLKGVLAQDDSHSAMYMILGMIAGLGWRIKQNEDAARLRSQQLALA